MNKRVVLFVIFVITIVITNASAYALIRYNGNNVNLKQYEDEVFEVKDEMLVLSGWVGVEELPVMSEPSELSDTVGSLSFNEEFEYMIYNSDWFEIVDNDAKGYVSSKNVLNKSTGYDSYSQYELDKIIGYESYSVPNTSGFKSYMDYRSITYIESRQYELQNRYAETGNYGIRMVNGRYCVAVGSYFTDDVGQYLDLILEDGTVIPCILADQKADIHTDSNNIVTMHNGCMSEFIIDSNFLVDSVKKHGNISYCNDNWKSKVVEVRVYNKNIFEE